VSGPISAAAFARLCAWASDLLQGEQAQRVVSVALGAGSAHAALFLASPLLTRLYAPGDFGLYAYFFAAISFLAPLATLRYEVAILLPASASEARATVGVSLAASCLTAFFVTIGLAAWRLFGLAPIADLPYAILIGIPLGIFLSGIYQTSNYWALRNEHFRRIAFARGGLGVGAAVSQVLLGLILLGPLGLIIGDLTGRLVAGGVLAASLWPALGGFERFHSVRAAIRQAVRFQGFPLLSSPSIFLNALGLFLPLFAVGHFFGTSTAGMLFLTQRVIGIPATLLVTAASQVYSAEFIKADRADHIALYDRTLQRLAMLTAPFFVGAALAAPAVFPVVFGEHWATAGQFAKLLTPLYFCQLLSGATVSTLDLTQRHGIRFLREGMMLGLTAGVFAIPYFVEIDSCRILGIFSVVGALFYLASIVYIRTLMSGETR